MAIRGERFNIDLDDSDDDNTPAVPSVGLGLVGDIRERAFSSNPRPPSPPRIKSSTSGFPAHKDRIRSSRFKQNQGKTKSQPSLSSPPETQSSSQNAKPKDSSQYNQGSMNANIDSGIDDENNKRLASMSEDEIAAARQELLSGLSPSLIEKLLKKANIDEDSHKMEAVPRISEGGDTTKDSRGPPNPSAKKVTFSEPPPSHDSTPSPSAPPVSDLDAPPLHPPSDLHLASSPAPLPSPRQFHFPTAPTLPSLNPDDPNFLNNLHSTYFPSLPSNPSSLSWLLPPTDAERRAYSPTSSSLPPSSLRFDFRGRLLPPRLAAQIPISKGLHHHGLAPESAGYTIPELGMLARSTVSAQRCVGFQTLGRLLFRLGRGDFGTEGEEGVGEGLCDGIWEIVGKERVVEILEAAAAAEGGNRSVWVMATEAIWLWRKGGGRRWRGR